MQVCHGLLASLVPLMLVCLVQHTGALPSPDFGVPATINPARTEVVLEAALLTSEFVDVTNVSITLVSGTHMLTQVQTAVVSIGRRFRDSGVALMQLMVTLATSNGTMGMANAFQPVYAGIESLQNLTRNGFSSELMSISSVIPSTVTQKFNDAFREMRNALDQLRQQLEALERDVRKARKEAGNAPTISEKIVRNNIPARTQSDVTKALIALRARIQDVRYMVRTTLHYLREADEFLQDVVREVNAFGTALHSTLSSFSGGMDVLKQDTVQYIQRSFGCGLDEQTESLSPVLAQLQAIANFASTLQEPFDEILAQLGPDAISASTDTFVQNLNLFKADAVAVSSTAAGLFIRSATCQLLRTMILTLISFGPQNEYCFNRFASRVYSLYALHHNAVGKCYETELERLTTMVQFLHHVVDVVLYDVEELYDNLSVCVNLLPGRDASCVEQDVSSEPRPDFGIDGKIAGSIQAGTVAAEASESFDQINFKTITLKSHYTVLKTMQAQLTIIGNNISTTGMELTGTLEVLAPSQGILPQVYDNVTGAIGNLRTLLDTGLAAQKTAIEQLVGKYISDMLDDASRQLRSTLTRLTTQLGLIQTSVNQAVAAYGSSTIPETFLRRYVSPKVVFELLRAMHDLNSDLPLVTYIIELTLGHLSTADAFLLQFMDDVDGKVLETIMHYDTLKQEITQSSLIVGNAIITPIKISYEKQISSLAFIRNSLAAMPTYEESLKPVLNAYEALLGSTNRLQIPPQVDTIYVNYLKDIVKLDDYLDRFFDEKLCTPIKEILKVLIASGPWAEYCFSKYSPRLLGLVSVNSNRFLMCYQIEADRLAEVALIVDRLMVQIVYDVEDLAAHLIACFNLLQDGAECIASIGPDYSQLVANLKLKVDDVLRLLTTQTKASYNRAAACVAGGKCGFVASAETYVKDIKLVNLTKLRVCIDFNFLHDCCVPTMMLLPTSVLLPVLLFLGALQRIDADPRPDFAIKATISGTQNVIRNSGRVNVTFDLVDNVNVTLTSGYTLLNDIKAAITFIGSKIAASGMTFTATLNNLANDRSNNVTGAFATVNQTIINMRTLLQSGLSAQFTTLQKQGPFITKQLTDAFNSILDRLTLFSGALERMKTGVTAARDAPGNPPDGISSDNLSRFVPLKLSIDLQDALSRLNADIPLVTFVVEETQRRLVVVDAFVDQMRNEGQTVVSEITSSKDVLLSDVDTISANVNASINEHVVPVYNEQLQAISKVQTELLAISTYADDLKPSLDSLAASLDASGITTLTAAIAANFTAYKSAVDASVANASSVQQFLVGETCVGLRSVINALVASSPYSNFCYSKFSPQILNQFSLSYYVVSECYDFEIFRLYQLQDLMSLIVNMIIYDVEDLGAAIAICAPLKDGSSCLTMIGPYYETLATTVSEKQAYIVDFIQEETKFSLQRLGACIVAAKYTTVISVAATVSNLNRCILSGPLAS
uniref:Secreted protein n=1 Tax=Anopheles christyi TaxID=43041 RepID=A0A182JVT4_9DIPT